MKKISTKEWNQKNALYKEAAGKSAPPMVRGSERQKSQQPMPEKELIQPTSLPFIYFQPTIHHGKC